MPYRWFPTKECQLQAGGKTTKGRFWATQNKQALQDMASPVNHLTSFQLFYDTMENRIRGLESLGRSHESYGDLFVPIILRNLHNELRKNLASKHHNPECKFQELREAIVKKI